MQGTGYLILKYSYTDIFFPHINSCIRFLGPKIFNVRDSHYENMRITAQYLILLFLSPYFFQGNKLNCYLIMKAVQLQAGNGSIGISH